MDGEVQTSREIELEVRLQRIQTGALEVVQTNGELLQVLLHRRDKEGNS